MIDERTSTETASCTFEDGPGSAPAGPALARGSTLGRFVVLHALGTGGMGNVYAAHDPELDRRVAVKVLRADRFAAPGAAAAQARLLLEARAMARLQHPHAATIFEAGQAAGRVYLAMELIEGCTLREWLAAGPRPWRRTLALLRQAGEALAAAHAAGLAHRDFKPSNVMVTVDGRSKVVDFGLAHRAATEADAHADLAAFCRCALDALSASAHSLPRWRQPPAALLRTLERARGAGGSMASLLEASTRAVRGGRRRAFAAAAGVALIAGLGADVHTQPAPEPCSDSRVASVRHQFVEARTAAAGGDDSAAADRASAALEAAQRSSCPSLVVEARLLASGLAGRRGDRARQRDEAMAAAHAAQAAGDPTALAAAFNSLTLAAAMSNETGEARRWATLAEVSLRRLGNRPDLLRDNLFALGVAALQEDRNDEAIERFERYLAGTRAPEGRRIAALNNLGVAHLRAGRLDAAAQALLQGLDELARAEGVDRRVGGALFLTHLGQVALDQGRPASALATFRRSLDLIDSGPSPHHPIRAVALVGIGEVLLAMGRPGEARAPLEEAVALPDAVPRAAGNARFLLARALAATGGDPERAVHLAGEAIGLFALAGEYGRHRQTQVAAWLVERGSRA